MTEGYIQVFVILKPEEVSLFLTRSAKLLRELDRAGFSIGADIPGFSIFENFNPNIPFIENMFLHMFEEGKRMAQEQEELIMEVKS